MYKLTIERPECFSKSQITVLKIFEIENSIDSLRGKLNTIRFIQTSFFCVGGGTCLNLIPKVNTSQGYAAIYKEVL